MTAAEPFYIEADSPAILACINTYNEVTGENAKPFTKMCIRDSLNG